jgi:hypothetical protein
VHLSFSLMIAAPSGLYGIIAKLMHTTISKVQIAPSLVKHNCSQINFLLILYYLLHFLLLFLLSFSSSAICLLGVSSCMGTFDQVPRRGDGLASCWNGGNIVQ